MKKKIKDWVKALLGYYEYPLQLLIYEFKDYLNPKAVRDRVQYYYDNKWGAQLVAIRIISKSKWAKKKLSNELCDDNFIDIIFEDYES
jgi:hypothetical protein